MLRRKITLKIFLLLALTDLLETLMQFFFKKTSLSIGPVQQATVSSVASFVLQAFSSPYLWCGFILVFICFVIWTTALSKIDLSVAVPVASFSYVLVPLMSIVLLGEHVSWLRWTGIGFILAGVIIVSLSSRPKAEVS
ncbi:MAG: EamA family transporter [Candidatus Omnitrophica bacterium]|nr:EamA family transporter [Candidatus Omnitrophota bacterium]